MRRSKKVLSALFILFAFALALPLGLRAKPDYSKKEKKSCTFCHVKMGSKELNDAGKYYKEHNHSLEGYKAPSCK